MKSNRVCGLGMICVAMSCLTGAAMGASHTVKFDDLPLFSNFPINTNFTSFSVQVNVLPVNLTVGNSCTPNAAGAATIVTQSFNPCPLGSGTHQVIIDQVLLDFSIPDYMAQIGSSVMKIRCKYLQVTGTVMLAFDGICLVRPNFGAAAGIHAGVNGLFKVTDNGCRVTVKELTGTGITKYAIGGDVLYIDDVKASN